MKKCLVTEFKFSTADEKILKKAGIEVKYAQGDLNEEQLVKELEDCQLYVIGGTDRATKNVIERTNLELIIFWGTGYESYIDLDTAKKKNIKCANTPHANAYTVAEHTVALILDAVKQITYLNNETKRGNWNRRETWNLENKTIGIIGFGAIGGNVAKIMHNGFKMKVIYYSRSPKPELEKEIDAKKATLLNLMTNSDVVTLHIPLTEDTKNLINESNLKLMKKHALLINSTRSAVVEPFSLKKALENNWFSSAAFDTYYEEPAPNSKNDKWGLLSLPDNKFILTPHTAYGSKEAIEKTNEMVVENIISFLEKGEPKYKVG